MSKDVQLWLGWYEGFGPQAVLLVAKMNIAVKWKMM